jgi:pyruvate dehydrogenase E1 component
LRNIASKDQAELDAVESREWRDSLDYVLQSGGPAKVSGCARVTVHARQNGVKIPFSPTLPTSTPSRPKSSC